MKLVMKKIYGRIIIVMKMKLKMKTNLFHLTLNPKMKRNLLVKAKKIKRIKIRRQILKKIIKKKITKKII
jgi:hypothetical protein